MIIKKKTIKREPVKKGVKRRNKKAEGKPKTENKALKMEPDSEEGKPSFAKAAEGRYYEAVGRRKTAIARARIFPKREGAFVVNGKPYTQYFPTAELQQIADASLKKMKCFEGLGVSIIVKGGGLSAQAEAIRHATARTLVLLNPDFGKRLRRVGYLTRDPRMRERKKFGLKRARRAPQWQKR